MRITTSEITIERSTSNDIEAYETAAVRFADIMNRDQVTEDIYTAALIDLLNAYPARFESQRKAPENAIKSAAHIIRCDVDAITGSSCPEGVQGIDEIFTALARDRHSDTIRTSGMSIIPRVATLTLAACLDKYPLPRVS